MYKEPEHTYSASLSSDGGGESRWPVHFCAKARSHKETERALGKEGGRENEAQEVET